MFSRVKTKILSWQINFRTLAKVSEHWAAIPYRFWKYCFRLYFQLKFKCFKVTGHYIALSIDKVCIHRWTVQHMFNHQMDILETLVNNALLPYFYWIIAMSGRYDPSICILSKDEVPVVYGPSLYILSLGLSDPLFQLFQVCICF